MTTRIYTKTGDKGETGLFGGQRVSKDAARVEAYGTVDEFNALLGVARVAHDAPQLRELEGVLHDLQAMLFALGAELATPPDAARRPARVPADAVPHMEQHIDRFEAELPPLKSFILPAGSAPSAALHVARAVCRRAERRCVHLRVLEPDTDPVCVVLLNRMSDLLFVMARVANHRLGVADVPWHP